MAFFQMVLAFFAGCLAWADAQKIAPDAVKLLIRTEDGQIVEAGSLRRATAFLAEALRAPGGEPAAPEPHLAAVRSLRAAGRRREALLEALDLLGELARTGQLEGEYTKVIGEANRPGPPKPPVTAHEYFGLGDGVGMLFNRVPAGQFMMGSPAEEMNRREDETRHPVTLTRPFLLGIFPVTREQYMALMETGPGGPADDHHPARDVDWFEATEFCARMSRVTGRNVRLPTEAEWEYACRAGTETAYFWGDWYEKDRANINVGGPPRWAPVDEYPPNPWGFYDMHGNVFEWCADGYGNYPREAVTDPQGRPYGQTRVLRGGGAFMFPSGRSAGRYQGAPRSRGGEMNGFRVAMDD